MSVLYFIWQHCRRTIQVEKGKRRKRITKNCIVLYYIFLRKKSKIASATHFLKAEMRLLLCECKGRCQAGVSDGVILNLRKSLAVFVKRKVGK